MLLPYYTTYGLELTLIIYYAFVFLYHFFFFFLQDVIGIRLYYFCCYKLRSHYNQYSQYIVISLQWLLVRLLVVPLLVA